MISFFGIVSVAITLICIGAIILHYKVMKQRAAVDDNLAALDSVLRERLEILYEMTDTLPEAQELREMCVVFSAFEMRRLIKSLPKLSKAAEPLIETTSENKEALAANILETEQAIKAFNETITTYNAYIAAFPGRLMAFILGLEQEKDI